MSPTPRRADLTVLSGSLQGPGWGNAPRWGREGTENTHRRHTMGLRGVWRSGEQWGRRETRGAESADRVPATVVGKAHRLQVAAH